MLEEHFIAAAAEKHALRLRIPFALPLRNDDEHEALGILRILQERINAVQLRRDHHRSGPFMGATIGDDETDFFFRIFMKEVSVFRVGAADEQRRARDDRAPLEVRREERRERRVRKLHEFEHVRTQGRPVG